MTRFWLPGLVGLTFFFGFLVAATPARLLFDFAFKSAGVEAGQVQGRVWDAQLLRVQAGGLFIAEARGQLDPLSLLGLSARVTVTVSDPGLRGDGLVTFTPGGLTVEGASGVLRLDRISPELAFVAPDGVVQLLIDRLELDREGHCQAAQGQATTPALLTLGERYGVDLPVLTFALLCAGDDVGADLSGRSDAVDVAGRLVVGEAGLEGRIEARTSQRDVIAALSFAGFEQVDQTGYVLTLPLPMER